MPWQPKAGVPEYIDFIEFCRLAIAGGPSEWITNYFWMVTPQLLPAVQVCNRGAPDCGAPLDIQDFTGFLGANKLGAAAGAIGLIPKLSCIVNQQVFYAACEFRETMVCSSLGTYTSGPPDGNNLVANFPVPDCDWLAARYISGPGNGGHIVYWSTQLGQFQNNVCHDGFSQLDVNGVNWWSYPWDPSRNAVWINTDENAVTVELAACLAESSIAPVEPPAVIQPPGLPPPPAPPGSTPEDLAVELGNIERKLHILLERGINQEIADYWAPVPSDDPEIEVEEEEEIELDADVIGVIVTLSVVSTQIDARFGEPWRLNKVGRVCFGTDTAWLAPQWLHVTPQAFLQLPPGVKRVKVSVLPPATATVKKLKAPKPVG